MSFSIEKLQKKKRPKLVEALSGKKIHALKAGGCHMLAIEKISPSEIYVYTWGLNRYLFLLREKKLAKILNFGSTPICLKINKIISFKLKHFI